ncbi:metal-dependent hydrolase family protein [Bradyrhizobium australiense]|uniref:Amidohydrolase family protein n=1 Tax=Bradyrhizobium australiense TaxID=2721161 RepID=A0A7Y4LWA3_9BRAD|nr:amidohydrolase family protein [Bradyrhizobium australiense]NOJ41252.1 amidohydrolase family protein [Bradyrhizobium australiense]
MSWHRVVKILAVAASTALSLTAGLLRVQAQQGAAVLFQNVRIFDGRSDLLSGPSNVLVRDNKIQKILPAATTFNTAQTVVIDGEGRVLMPGLIDAHWHAMMVRLTPAASMGDVGYNNIVAADEAADTLMRGFTTVRDLGGPAFGLKRAIDDGLVAGPRIYPSGAMITVTSGHGDFRQLSDLPRTIGGLLSRMEQIGGSMVADSPDEVRIRVREQLMQGASQVKLTAGGGVASPFSPLDVSTFTEAELRAAVEAAENWGTYVVTHAYTPVAIQRSIAAGVRCIEHGHLMDDATAKLMAEKGIWLSTQPFFDDEDATPLPSGSEERAKQLQVISGTDTVYALAKKYRLKTAFGTDILFSRELARRQGAQLAKLTRWYSAAEVLKMATSVNAELLALSGPRNPYPGKLGVVEEGAFADLLLVDGNPIDNIKLIEDPARNFLVIMKDGKIHKNLVASGKLN